MTDPTRTEQATAELRRADEPGWDEVSDRIKDVLRSAVLPATTVLADHAGRTSTTDEDERDLVSTRALRSLLRTALTGEQACPEAIAFQTEGERLTGVEIHLTVLYGTELPQVLARALDTVIACLDDALGRAREGVDVHVVAADLVEQRDWT